MNVHLWDKEKIFHFFPVILTVALQNYTRLILEKSIQADGLEKHGNRVFYKNTWDLNVTQIANVVPLRARVRPEFRTNFGV